MLKLLRKLLLLEMILRTPLLQLVLIELLWEFRMQIIILILVQLARLGIPKMLVHPVLLRLLILKLIVQIGWKFSWFSWS